MAQVPIPKQSIVGQELQMSIDALYLAQHYRLEYEALLAHVVRWTCAVDSVDDDILKYQDKVHEAECTLRAAVGIPAPAEVQE